MQFDSLLDEFPSDAVHRERISIKKSQSIVLFGAGHLGRRLLAVLRSHYIEPKAFADNQILLQGSQIDGIPILSVSDAAKQYGSTALFIVSIFRGSGDKGMHEREQELRTMGCRHVINFLPLAWTYSDELLPYYGAALPSTILSASDELKKVYRSWRDAKSQRVFQAQVLWRLRADFSKQAIPSPQQYFPGDIFSLHPSDAIVDAGAFDGDTLRVFGNNFATAWAIEPDPLNAQKLREMKDKRVTVLEYALGEKPSEGSFESTGDVTASLRLNGNAKVRIETLDRLLNDVSPTFIKLDIEGSEEDALLGSRSILTRAKPIVAVCLYHRPEHLWTIPRLLAETLPSHQLFLRSHQNDGFELVAYAVPSERVR